MSRKKREEKRKEQNVSAAVLLRTFEEHQLESLSEIAQLYRRIERALGYKNMQFGEHIPAHNGSSRTLEVLFDFKELISWKKGCQKWNVDPAGVELLARDNATFSQIVRRLESPRDRIILHCKCGLTVWSIDKNRCNLAELQRLLPEPDMSLRTR